MFGNALRLSRFGFASAGLMGLLCLASASAHAQVTVYNNNFNNGLTTGFTSSDPTLPIGTRTDGAQTYLATPGTMYGFGAQTVTLTLTNPSLVGTVTVGFDLYMIGSQDGNGPAGGGPDPWGLNENGVSLINTNFANYSGGGNTQAFASVTNFSNFTPATSGVAARTGSDAALAGQLGFGAGDFGDATYHLAFTFTNTNPTVAFSFFSQENEGVSNEGWGLDNVRVTSVPAAVTPEPGSVAMLVGIGVSGAGFLVRRKRARPSA